MPVNHSTWQTRKDMAGMRVGRWLVISFDESSAGKTARWLCRCDCGTERTVCGSELRKKSSLSCGCYAADVASARSKKHGRCDTAEYVAWRAMLSRCGNKNKSSYHLYGGRGISVCRRWREFANFLSDMGEKPSPGHSLDRIDTNGDYSPENCRWATNKEQSRNRRKSLLLTIGGSTKPLKQWAEEGGIEYHTVWYRLKIGWDAEAAVTVAPRKGGRRNAAN